MLECLNPDSWKSPVRVVLIAAICAMVGAFAPASAKTPATYVSLGKYREFSCPQLAEEAQGISRRVMALSGEKQSSSHPAFVASNQRVVVWPSALDDSGKPASGEIALAKEQMLAIEDASIQSQCEIEFRRATY
jgi:hypothetical protein